MANDKQGSEPTSDQLRKSKERISSRKRKKYANLEYLQPLFRSGIAEKSPVKYDRCRRCSSTLRQEDGKLKSSFCNKRFCAVCNHRRTAILIEKFIPKLLRNLRNGHQHHHTVLTFRTNNNNNLQKEYNLIWTIWDKVKRSIEYHLSDGKLSHKKPDKFSGVIRLEINWKQNDKYPDGKYHPHFHILAVGDTEVSHFIRKKWLYFCDRLGKEASYNAQEGRIVSEAKGALREMFKYIHKPATEDGKAYPPQVIDNIFRTIKGKRTIRSYGNFRNSNHNKNLEEEVKEELEDYDPNIYAFRRPEEKDIWEYEAEENAYYSTLHGDQLLPTDEAHTRTGTPALTRQDNPHKMGSEPPPTAYPEAPFRSAIGAYTGHTDNLSGDASDTYRKKLTLRYWKEHKAKQKGDE
jgi:hypothetical protein